MWLLYAGVFQALRAEVTTTVSCPSVHVCNDALHVEMLVTYRN